MKVKFFIDHPIVAFVISVLITALGLFAFFSLPVERYPDIAPPAVSVSATYPGAKAETVLKSVVAPLEEALNGVENVNYITSTANNDGQATINIFFFQGTDHNIATVNVQNTVSTVTSLLPAEVVKAGIVTQKQFNNELKTVMLYSPDNSFPEDYIDNYMSSIVVPRLQRVKGVGRVMKYGSEYALRIWLDPDKMAQYSLIPDDISNVLNDQNLEIGTGSFGENHDNAFQYSIKYKGRLTTPQEFSNIVLRSQEDGSVLRLGDVAKVEMGRQSYSIFETVEGRNGSGVAVFQADGSNASKTIRMIDSTLEELSKDLPKGLEFRILFDANRFLYASMRDIAIAFMLSIILVLLVVFFFIQNAKATIIPAVSILVSVIGTFGFMYIAGFSINILTMFALVLCIGTVVDDSIVVVEAVQEKFLSGYKSHYKATCDAMGNVSLSIVISTLIFMSVFIPVAMIGGTAGKFYTQFGLTMAAAVGISAINSLTLSPVLSILLIHPLEQDGPLSKRFREAFQTSFEAFTGKYTKAIQFFVKRKWLAIAIPVVSAVALVFLAATTKTALIPQEDSANILVSTSAVPGTSMADCGKVVLRLDSLLRSFPEIELCTEESGFSILGSGPNMGQFFILLKDWKYRRKHGMGAQDVIDRIYSHAPEFPEINLVAMQTSMIQGYNSGSNFELYLQDKNDGDIARFQQVSQDFLSALRSRPEISQAYASFSSSYPQYQADVDAALCMKSGVSVKEVLSTLGAYLGGSYASNFNRFSRIYRVMIQATPESRISPESLEHLYVRTNNGMAPLSNFVKLTKTYGPEYITRFNLYNSIPVSASPQKGYSTGDAIKAIAQTADEYLPSGYGYEFGGLSREENASKNSITTILIVCIALIYLILCSLYGSFVMPFVIILSVPCGLAGAFLFTRIFGLENNIYLHTALILLIGLLSKTAILITDYAANLHKEGQSIAQAAMNAAKMRLRPILMTSLTMIFGLLPLLFANGAGAKSNATIGSSAIGGMLIGTLVMLLIVPVLWMAIQNLHEKLMFKFFGK